MRVLVTDPLSSVALDLLTEAGITADVQLSKTPEELKHFAKDADGWIIRSGTHVTAELLDAAGSLKVIGRAGVGVDNIDLEVATKKGVLVVNAPDGNTVSTAEHTCAMMLALARRIPGAASSLAGGVWDRKQFSGAELDGKTLGVVGVGKIGRAVALRMQAFGMRVIGYDPVLSTETAERLNIELVPLERIWAESDVLTFHTPLNETTRGLLNTESLAQCKDGIRIVNIARGGIVDESAILPALESGKVAGVALDVYSQEPPPKDLQALLAHPNVVATPHIAASTQEAQKKVAVQIVDQVIKALRGEPVSTPVNARAIQNAAQPEVAPYLDLAERLGSIGTQLAQGRVEEVKVGFTGAGLIRYADVLTLSVLVGVLNRWSEIPVNLINAQTLADEMGLRVEEVRHGGEGEYSNLLEVTVISPESTRTIKGTLFGKSEARLVGFDEFPLEVRLEGHLLFYQNEDRPGMLATVGGLLAEADINIAGLSLGREAPGTRAITVLTTDQSLPEQVVRDLHQIKGVDSVFVVSL